MPANTVDRYNGRETVVGVCWVHRRQSVYNIVWVYDNGKGPKSHKRSWKGQGRG